MIHFNDYAHGEAIAAALGIGYNPKWDVIISRTDNGEFLGGILYTGYTGASITTHMVGLSPRWLNREFLWVIFDYPFNQLGCRTILAPVPSNNLTSLEITHKMGFKEAARVPDVYLEGDLVLMAITPENCKWLSLRPEVLKETGYYE